MRSYDPITPFARVVAAIIITLVPLATAPVSLAATLYWDADGSVTGDSTASGMGLGGSGMWDTSSVLWWDGASSSLVAWPNSGMDTAIFTGAGGVIQLVTPISLQTLTFNSTGFNVTGDGASGTNTLTLSAGNIINVNSTGTDTISAVVAGSNGLNLSSNTTGTLVLANVANTFNGGVTINSGTLAIAADGSLGASGNTITFNNGTGPAGLLLGVPITLNASRTITLSNTTGVALLSSSAAAQDVVLGQITGAGTFGISNAGTTYLLNSTNNYTGILWSQSGMVSVQTLTDAAGYGNIKLGNAATTGGIQWATGVTSALNLANRSIELAGTTGGGTIDSSSIVAADSITIANNLVVSGAGAKTLTLQGVNAGVNTFAGNIINGTAATALTKSGVDLWQLTGTGNNYTGAISINQGTLKVTDPSGFGGTGTLSFATSSTGQGIEYRADTAPTGIRSINNNSATSAYIFLDHAATAGNTTTGQIITFGTVAQANNTALFTVVGDHGYGAAFGLNTLAASNSTAATLTTYTITNDLGSPGLTGYTLGSNEYISIAGFSESGSNTAGVTQTLNGWGNYTVTGPISNTGTQPVNLTKSGLGVLTFSPSSTSGWTLGTFTVSGGTANFTSAPTTAGATLTFGGGLVQLRNDASTNFTSNVLFAAATSTLVVDHSLTSGTGTGQTAMLGTISGNNTATLDVVGDHGYSLTTGTVTITGAKTLTLGNYLGAPGYTGYTGGSITLGNGTTAVSTVTTGAAGLTLGGFGNYVFAGTVGMAGATTSLNITQNSLGVLTYNGNDSGWTAGTANTTLGTTVIDAGANITAIGNAAIGVAGGLTVVRNNGNSALSANNLTLQTASGTLVAAPEAGSFNTGNTLTLGSLTSVTTGLTFSFDTNHNYGINISGTGTTAIAATTINNIGDGTVTFAGGLTNTAATVWTLGGNGDFNVSGNLLAGTSTTGVTKTGFGTLTLGGSGNTYTGALTLTAGILKITTALGTGTGTLTFNNTASGLPNNNVIGLDLRNNSSMDISTHPLGRVITTVFNVDNNGSGTNGTITLGSGLSLQDNGYSFLATGANGYSLKFAGGAATKVAVAAGSIAYTIFNYIPSISGSGNMEFNGGLAFQNTASTGQLTFGGTGDYLLSGTVSGTVGDTLTKSGLGTLTITADSSATWNTSTANNIYTQTAGITRATVAGALGGANAKVNLNAGVLDLRNDTGFTVTAPITVGATNSYINVDRAIGGAGTGQTMTLSGVGIGAFTLFTTGADNYSLNTGTVTQTGASVIINNIGSTGALTIPTLTGTFNSTIGGAGSTNITTAMTLVTGTLTKTGTGTLTISGNTSNTNGAVAVNGGALALDYSGGAASNILQSAALTLANGKLTMKGNGTTAAQSLTTAAFSAGQDAITMIANGGTANTLTFSGASTATNAGSTILITSPANTSVVFGSALSASTAQGRNLVFFDGTNYNWAVNTAAGATTTGLGTYTTLPATGGTSTVNYQLNGVTPSQTLTAAVAGNSLKVDTTTASGTLALNGFNLTLTQGGLLFVGGNNYSITNTVNTTTGLKSAIGTNSDTVINNYGTGTLTISAPIITGTGTTTATFGGTGTTIVGNASLNEIGTYAGITYVNGGTVQLATGVQHLGATTSAPLTLNGGTLDLNANSVGVGNFNGAYAGTLTNSSTSTPVTFTIGNGNGTGTFLGTITNAAGGALSLVKTGTGAITLGDVNGMSSLAFTGDLTVNTAGAAGANVLTLAVPLADSTSAKINLGTATSTDTVQITYSGSTNMVLNNRQLDLNGQSNATITATGVAGINGAPGMVVINSNVLTDGTGAKTLTLGGTTGAVAPGGGTVSGITGSGSVITINTINGNIGNASGGGALTLAFTGSGGWSLGGNNSFTGGVTMGSTGIVRGTSANAFGGSANTITWSAAGQLDLRSDSSLNFGNPISWGNAALKINVDRAINGTGYGQVMTLGAITETVTAQTLTVTNALGVGGNLNGTDPIGGYGLRIAGLVLNAGTATTISNAIGGASTAQFAVPASGTGVAGALTIDGITTAASLGTHTLTIGSAGNSDPVTIITGDIVQNTGTTVAVTYTGNNLLTMAGQTAATNFSGGLNINPAAAASAATVRATTLYSLGSGTVTFGTANAATLEVRNDNSVTYSNPITINNSTAATDKLNVGESINGSTGNGNTFSFGQLTFQGISGNGLTVSGIAGSNNNSGDSVTFNGVSLNLAGAAGFTVTSNLQLPGVLTLGNVTSTGTSGTQTLTIAGTGSVVTLGDVTNSSGGITAITSNIISGILDLTRMTSASNFSGGLTISNGTTRVANIAGASSTSIGASTNPIIFNGSVLELRSDVNVTYSNPLQLLGTGTALPALGSGINVGQLTNGSGVNSGITFTLGQFKPTAAGKIFTINGIGGGANSAVSLASNGDSVTFGGVDLNGTTGGTTTINNNLPLPGMVNLGTVTSSASGAVTLSVGGSGVTYTGDIATGSATTLGVTNSGSGILDLSRVTTGYNGVFTQNGSGTTRITNVLQLGSNAAGISLQNGNLEIRSDTNFTYSNPLNWNANGGNVGIFVGEVGTGTTTGVGSTFNFGALTITTASGKVLTVGGIAGTGASSSDNVVISGVTFGAGNLSNTITNNLSLPGTLSLGNITGAAATAATLTISGAGFTTVGDIINGGGGGTAALAYSGSGILQVTGTGASNYTGGISVSGGSGILRLMGASSIPSTGTIALTNGTLDIRTDLSLTVSNPITTNTNNTVINVDQMTTGNVSNTVTFNGAATSLASGTAKTLTITSGSNYGITFSNGFTSPLTGNVITNNASGTVNLGPISYTSATAGSIVLSGSGYTTVGNITGATVAPTLTYSGTGLLDLTGNNGATNLLSAVTLSGAGGITKVNNPTNLGTAGDTINMNGGTLQIRNDGSGSGGTISFANPIVLNSSSTNIIDVGNAGAAANTGNTVAFGAFSVAGASANTTTFNGANGYGVSFTSAALPTAGGQTTNWVANVSVTITGNVTNAMSGFATTNFDTLVLDGVAGGTINGTISDATGGSLAAGGYTPITKQGTGTWTLNGADTNQGATKVNGGMLVFNGSSPVQNAYTVTGSNVTSTTAVPGATLAGTGNIAGPVTLATGTATTFAQGATINPGLVGTAGTLTIGGALTTNNFTRLNFDLTSATTVGSGVNDLISAATLPVVSGNTQVTINTLGSLSLGSVYTLINGYSGTIANPSLALAFTGVDTTHSGVLQNNSGMLQLLITNPTPSTAYWSGAIDGNWNTATVGTATTNWRTDATSNTDTFAAPGANTDVHFVTTTPSAGNLTTTLGQSFTIQTLNFDPSSTSAVSISGSTLTITPASSSTGLSMDAAAGNVFLNSGVILGAAQTWTNNSTTSVLTVNGNIANGGNLLTIAGPGGNTAAGVISGAGGLAVTNGSFNITGITNTFTGNITVDGAGSVLSIVGNSAGTFTSSNPLGNATAVNVWKTVTLTNGGTFSLTSLNYNVNTISTNLGGGQVFMIGTGGGTFNVAAGSTFTLDDGNVAGTTSSASAELQGTGDLTKTGNGILSLGNSVSNFSSFTGNIFVQAGTLKTGDATAIFSNITLGSATTNGTLDINSYGNTITGLYVASGATAASQIVGNGSTTAAGTLNLNVSGTDLFSGTIQNTVATGTKTTGITMSGAGNLILTGANTYSGGTNIQNGSIQLAGGDNRLFSGSGGTTNVVTLGSASTNNSGLLIIGGDSAGGSGAGNQHTQTLTQNSASGALVTAGTGTANSVIGGAAGGTSSGTPANNSVINLNIGTGFTDTYNGLIGYTGTGSIGNTNNINLQKSGGGTLVISANLSNWTGLTTDGGPNVTDLAGDSTRPEIILSGGVLRLTSTAVINTVILNTGGVIDDLGATYGNNYFLVVSGGLISFSQTTDSYSNSGLTSLSHGVGALNIAGNTGVTDYAGSDMYLGAVGARVFSGATLAAGAGSTYRLGGGAPWQALGSAVVGGSGGYLQVTATNVITGANNLIIGDNGTYNSGAGLFGSNSTVEINAAQNYTGTSTLAGGTFVFSNAGALGTPATTAGSIILDGGILRYNGLATDLSSRITIDSGGTIDTNGQSVVFATALGNSPTGTSGLGNGGLSKNGAGTLTLSKANTYVGLTSVNQGTLALDFNQTGAATSDILNNGSAGFGFNGGTLTVNAKGSTNINNQNIVATNLNAGTNILNLTTSAAFSGSGALNVALGQINRSSGSGLNIVAGTNVTLGTTGSITTTNLNNSGGILGGFITTSGTGITGNTWAVSGATQATGLTWDGTTGGATNTITGTGTYTNGTQVSFSGTVPSGLTANQAYYVVGSVGSTFQVSSSLGGSPITLNDDSVSLAATTTVNSAGPITGLSSYYTTTTGGNTAANYLATANVDVTSSPTISAGITINSLRFSSTTTQTLTLTGTNVIGSGGILISSAVGNVATAITGGTIEGSAGGELIINNYDTSSTFTINSIIADNGSPTGLTKNGTGAASILIATNTYSGQTVINGGTLTMDAQARYGSTTGFTLNGGTLNWSAAAALPKIFTLGLNGGTLNISDTTGNRSVGTAGDNLLFQGLGARTLTLNGATDRKMTFNFSIGDNGGPTNLTISGGSDTTYLVMAGSNTYTGVTTISRGILDLSNAGSLPGGLGGITQTSANTGGGNLTFAATGTTRAVLQFEAATNGGFYRSLGTGIDQVQWTGNGGFSNNTTGTLVVNLGGASAGVTWGSGGFVPTGNILDFGQSAANTQTSGGAIDFQNPINLGTAVRTIDVSNGVNNNSTGVDAILSGALTGGAGGGLTKTGAGVLKLTANNSAGTSANAATSVIGTLVLANAGPADLSALPGSGSTNRTLTINAGGAVVLTGQSDPTALLSRVVTTSAGGVALDTSSSATLDFSAFSALGLGAYSDIGGTPVYFSGSILPNSNVFRFNAGQTASGGAVGSASTSVQAAVSILVLNRTNMLTDNGATPRSVNFAAGEYYLTGYNTYAGGTVVNSTTGGASQIGIGNDSAFGTGAISASPTTASTAYFGALNGDHVLSNNLTLGVAGNLVVSGNTATRGIANAGSMTYAGTVNLPATVNLYSEGGLDAIFLGDLKPTGATTAVTFNNNVSALYSLLTIPNGAVNKTFTSSTINVSTATVVIDSDRSLGVVPAAPATNLTFSTSAGVLEVQPGTSSVTLSANRNIVFSSTIGAQFNTPGSTISIAGVTTGGLQPNSTLTVPGIMSGMGAATTGFVKLGLGTLILQGADTFTSTGAGGLNIQNGTLELDSSTGTTTVLTNTAAATPLFLGSSANGTFSTGGTLLVNTGAGSASNSVFSTTINAKDNFITLNSTGGAITLGLGTVTAPATGGTLNIKGTGIGSATVNATFTPVNGILPGATWGGTDLVAASGTALSQYSGYTTPSGATPTVASGTTTNVKIDSTSSGTTVLSAGTTSINTLTFADTAARTIGVGTGNTLNFGTAGMILDGTGAGALTIGTSGTAGTVTAGGAVTNTSGELILANYSSNTMVVNSVIANNGTGVTTIVKSGTGVVTLAGASTYTGSTYVNGGVLQYSDASAAAKAFGSPTVAAANIIMNGGALRYTGSTANTNIFGTTFNSVSAIDVPNAAATVTMGTTTALSGTTGIAGVAGILQKTGAGALTFGGSVDNANLSVEVVGGTLNLGKTSTSSLHSVSGGAAAAALIIDSGTTANITGTGGDQIYDGSSVVVKTGGTLNLSSTAGVNEAFDGLAGGGTVTSTAAVTLSLGGSSANAAASNNESNIGANTLAAANAGVAATGLNYFSGVIGGAISLTKYGAGLQTLANNNTYSGATTIQAGTLKFGVANALPSGTGKGDVTIVGNTVINALTVPGTFDLSGYNQAINGLNSTTGGYVTNTPTLSNNGTAWGTTVAGTFSTSATSGTNTLTLGNNNATGSFNGTFQDGFTVIPVAGIGAGIGVYGYLAVTKTGTGIETLSGASTATGALTVNQGEVDLNTTGGNAWTGNVVVNTAGTLKLLQGNQIADTATVTVAGGTFRLFGNTETVAGVSLTNAGVIQDSIGGGALTSTTAFDLQSGTASGVLAGGVGATKTTTGTVTLSGANTFTGPVNIQNGTLSVSSINSVSGGTASSNLGAPTSVANGTISLGSTTTTGTLLYTGGAYTTDRVINLAGTTGGGTIDQSGSSGNLKFTSDLTASGVGGKVLTLQGSTAATGEIAGAIVDNGVGNTTGVTKAGSGTWTLSNANDTYTGITTVSNGVLALAAASTNNIAGSSAINITGTAGATSKLDVTGLTSGTIALASAQSINGTGTGTSTVTGAVSLNGSTLSATTGDNLVISTGNIAVNGSGNTISTTGTGTVTGTATLASGAALAVNGKLTGNTVVGTGTLSGTGSVSGTTSVTGGTVNGSGLLLTGATTFNSTGNILSGTVTSTAGVTVASGGALADNGALTGNVSLTSTAALSGTGSISGTVTLNGSNTLSGTGTLTTGPISVNGTGNVLSSGTVAGNATINNGGVLTVAGTLAGTASVLAGGTLSGTGTINGAVTIAGGTGTINLQDLTVGTLTLGSSLALGGTAGNTSALLFDIGSSSVDTIAATGVLTLNAGGASVSLNQLSGTPLAAATYNLLTYASKTGTGAIAFVGGGTTQALGGGFIATLNTTSTAEQLIVSAVATPTSAYWTGAQGSSWSTISTPANNTNWATTAAGTTDANQVPGSTSSVYLTATSAANLSTTLDGSYSINSLNFTNTGTGATTNVTIASGSGTNTLTIGSGGINDNATSAANTISANVALGAPSETWTNNSTGALAVSGSTITGSGDNLTIAGTGTTNVSASIQTVTGNVTVQGGATAALTGSNTYTGVTTVSIGSTLNANTLANGGTASSIGQSTNVASNLVLDGGTLGYTGATTSSDRLFTVTANGGTINSSGTGPLTLSNTGAESITGGSPTLTLTGSTAGNVLAGQITDPTSGGGTTSVAVTGTGSWNLANATNSYTGSTTIGSGATLNATTLANGASASSIGASTSSASNLVIGGTLQYTGSGATNGTTDRVFTVSGTGATLDGSGASGSPMVLTSTTAPVYSTGNQPEALTLTGTNTDGNTLAAPITDNGSGATSLNKTGTGTWTVTGASTNTGATTVSAGTLVVNNATGNGTGTGAINVTGGNLQVGVGSVGSTSATSTITASGTAGTPTTTGGVDYTNTPVANPQNVVSGPAVSGSGTINGSVVIGGVSSVGVLKPGDSAGIANGALAIGGSLTVNTGSQIQLSLGNSTNMDPSFNHGAGTALAYLNANGGATGSTYLTNWATPASGSSYDTLFVGGTLTINSSGIGGSNTPSILINTNGASYADGEIFKLLDWAGLNVGTAIAGTFAANIATDLVLPDLSSSGLSWDTSAFTTYGVVVVVPEPGRASLMLLGLAALLVRRRRRK